MYRLKFWGVRGSIPSPISSDKMLYRIQSIVERMKPSDLLNEDAKQAFISSLPLSLTGIVGSNTACVEISIAPDEVIIFDAGSGIRELGKDLVRRGVTKIHLFFSHFHWDHIQGLPFFDPLYIKDCEINFYSPREDFKELIACQMKAPYFPVDFENNCPSRKYFHVIEVEKPFMINNIEINTKELHHPNTCYAYSCTFPSGRKFIYATDTELKPTDFADADLRKGFYHNADIIVLDAQYTVQESITKENWGHSAFCYAVDFANHCNCQNLFLFHHEPTYDDKKLYAILEQAQWYAKTVINTKMKVHLAKETLEMEL